MGSLTDDQPKCFLEAGGRRLIDWQLDALRAAGAESIAVVTGYRRELLAALGLVEFHNPRWSETNMVSSLACAAEWLEHGPCLVSYADLYYEAPGVQALANCDRDLAITFDPEWEVLWRKRFGDPLIDAETFRLKPDGTVAEIGGRPQRLDQIEGQYMGLLRFTPEGWRAAHRTWSALDSARRDKTHMTGLLQLLIDAGAIPVYAVPYLGRWAEFDSPQDVAALGMFGQ